MMKSAPAVLALLLAPLLITVGHAQSSTQVPESLLACSRLEDPAERVRCYDRQVASMKAAAASTAKASSAAAPARATAPASVQGAASASASVEASAPVAAVPSTPQVRAPPVPAPAATAATAAPQTAAPTPAAVSAPPIAEGGAATAPATAPQQPSAAQFGAETLPLKAQPKVPERELVLYSRITGIDEVRPDVFVISLANGQVWAQEGSQRSQVALFFHSGDDVRIEKGRLGSYRLSSSETGNKNWVYVRRIQ